VQRRAELSRLAEKVTERLTRLSEKLAGVEEALATRSRRLREGENEVRPKVPSTDQVQANKERFA
jgi:hypothetical protein